MSVFRRTGLIDLAKGRRIFDLAVPVMITGGLRTLVRTVDYFMVSLALGSAAIAALEFGYQFHMIALGFGLAVSGGTISVVSRFIGADEPDRANLALKQSLWLTLLLSTPMMVVAWIWAPWLVGILTDDARAIDLGATYLRIIMLSTPFHFWALIGSRALAGAGDTKTPMVIRSTSLPSNTIINALLIFGLGPFPALGVAGAAIGTTIANVLQAAIFMAVFLSGRFGLSLSLGGRQLDLGIIREIVRVSSPLAGTRIAQTGARFPFLFILGALGTEVVAAYAIGRRIMSLALTPAWGYGTAASTLVGQAIGEDDETEATAYGWESVKVALLTQIPLGAFVILAADSLARLFDPDNLTLTVQFVYVFGIGLIGNSIRQTLEGALQGAGDTSFPFYGSMVGSYLVRIPVAALALPAGFVVGSAPLVLSPGLGLGLLGVFLAILGDIYARAGINFVRYRSGRWMEIGRAGTVRMNA